MLSKATELYEQGFYQDAFNAALEIAVESPNVPACILMVKSLLNLQTDPTDDEAMDIVHQAISAAVSAASNIEDIWTIQIEVTDAMYDWSSKLYQTHFSSLETNPIESKVLKTFHLPVGFSKNDLLLCSATAGSALAEQYREENNLTINEYYNMLRKRFGPHPCYVSNTEVISMSQGVARKIHSMAMDALDDIAHTSADYVLAKLDGVGKLFLWAELLAGFYIDEDTPTELAIAGYTLKAESLNNYLNAVVYPNGRAVHLASGDRSYFVSQLREAYEGIQARNPSFEMPQLPDVHVVDPTPAFKSSSTGSGGCYVATAIYGSYDCPEVWTLRRFRDNTLASTWYGRAFIRTYYAVSPTLVKWFGHTTWFKNMWRGKLDKMVYSLQKQGVESTPYHDVEW